VDEGQLCLCRHGGGRYYKLDEHEETEQRP
jgi:hypothetical protein